MIPNVTFQKSDYFVACNSQTSVTVDIVSGGLDGMVYLELASNDCTFSTGEKILEKNFSKNSTTESFTIKVKCSSQGIYYTQLFVWANNQDGSSIRKMATITINCSL